MDTILSILYLILSSIYILNTAKIIQIILKLNSSMTGAHAPDYLFLREIPLLLVLPAIFSIASLLFFHASLKIRQFTPLSFILGIIFLITIPIPLRYLATIIVEPVYHQFYSPFWKDPAVVVSTIILVLLIFGRKRFICEGQPLQKKSKIFLFIFFIIVVLPVLIWSEFLLYTSKNPDYKLTDLQNQMPFYIYEPTYFPNGRTYETTYFRLKKPLVSNYKTVEVDINYPIIDIMKGKKSGLIIVKQSNIPKNFNIKEYVQNNRKEITDIHERKIQLANQNIGFSKNYKNAVYIYFISRKNTLITIDGFYIQQKELINFINSFE